MEGNGGGTLRRYSFAPSGLYPSRVLAHGFGRGRHSHATLGRVTASTCSSISVDAFQSGSGGGAASVNFRERATGDRWIRAWPFFNLYLFVLAYLVGRLEVSGDGVIRMTM
jgi:hypothetical protein